MYFRLAMVALVTVVVSGCGTFQGAGEDLEAGKEKVENAISKNKRESTEAGIANPTAPAGPNPATAGTVENLNTGAPSTIAPGTEPGTTPNSQ